MSSSLRAPSIAGVAGLAIALSAAPLGAQDALERMACTRADGVEGDWNTIEFAFSRDGAWCVFASFASNIIEDDDNAWADGGADVFNAELTDFGGGYPIERASVRDAIPYDDGDANDCSYSPSISDGGLFVAFQSYASDLVAGDTNDLPDVFVRDRDPDRDGWIHVDAMATFRASVASDGSEADGFSYGPWVVPDGSAVWFCSHATNLVAGDTNGATDVFRHDLATRVTTRESLAWDGAQADGDCTGGKGSADGRYLLFLSTATNLVPGDANGWMDVFLRDLATGAVERISVATGGGEAGGPSTSIGGITGDGRFVLFGSYAADLVPGDTNDRPDCFVRDRLLGTTVRVNLAGDGSQADEASFPGAIADDGSRVAFTSAATNLDPCDADAYDNVYVRDLATGAVEVVFLTRSGAPIDGACRFASATPDLGRIGAIVGATNLVSWDDNGPDLAGEEPYVRDLAREIGAASWRWYGGDLPGKGRVDFAPLAAPALGTTVTFGLGNSAGYPTIGWLFGGPAAAAIRMRRATFANDLSLFLIPVVVDTHGSFYDASIADDPALQGISVFAQLAVADVAAPVGLALSRGIELVLGR